MHQRETTLPGRLREKMKHVVELELKSKYFGIAFYSEKILFGLYIDSQLYFRVNDKNKPDYEVYGMKPFEFQPVTTFSYYAVPQVIVDQRDTLMEWIEKAKEAARLF